MLASLPLVITVAALGAGSTVTPGLAVPVPVAPGQTSDDAALEAEPLDDIDVMGSAISPEYTYNPAADCCFICTNLACNSMVEADRGLTGGRLYTAFSVALGYTVLGAMAGIGIGCVAAVIPGGIFGYLSYTQSIDNGATVDDATNAAFTSFLLTAISVGCLGFLAGIIVGAIGGVIHAAYILSTGDHPSVDDRPRRRSPRRRRYSTSVSERPMSF